MGSLNGGQPHGQSPRRVSVGDDERPEKTVPAPGEVENGHRNENGLDDREDDAPIDAQVPASVHPGALKELVGEGQNRLTDEQQAQHGGNGGDEGEVVVDHVELAHHQP